MATDLATESLVLQLAHVYRIDKMNGIGSKAVRTNESIMYITNGEREGNEWKKRMEDEDEDEDEDERSNDDGFRVGLIGDFDWDSTTGTLR